MNIQFYSLLFVADGKSDAINFDKGQAVSHFDIYLRNGITLNRSLECVGYNLTIITNKPEFLKQRLALMGSDDLRVININFDRNIPDDINFYSAHYKLDVYKYFSCLADGVYSILLDLDMIAISNNWCNFSNLVSENENPIFYEITDQVVPAYGSEVIENDLYALTGVKYPARWFGGEFVAGNSHFYRHLSALIDSYYEKYTQIYRSLHHQGDEVLTTAAVLYMESEFPIVDGGENGIVCRFWSARTRHKQISMTNAFNFSLLHLPSDKFFLSGNIKNFDAKRICFYYSVYLIKKYAHKLVKTIF